jgi:thioesterase domain-containing protein
MGLLPYREAARLLGEVTDSFGIAEGTRVFQTIPEMAAAHVGIIRGVQPQGPYRIAGFCFGGNLAVEIASQLTAAGEEIELLCLLESSPPYSGARAVDWLKPANWFRILSRLPGRASGVMKRDRAANIRRLRMKTRSAGTVISGKAIPDINSVLDLTGLDAETQQRAATHWQALHLHEGRIPAVGHLAFVRAEQEAWIKRPADLGWQARGEFNIHTVPGRHEDFLRRHSASEVSRVMRSILETVNNGESTASQWKMNS